MKAAGNNVREVVWPIIVLDRHSGEISFLSDDAEAEFFAEEFEEVLASYFSFWDSAGKALMMRPRMAGPRVGPDDVSELLSVLNGYLGRPEAEEDIRDSIQQILTSLEKRGGAAQ